MINYIWVLLMAVGIIYAALNGRIDQMTTSAINAANSAVGLSFKLIGVMCLWLGVLKIAEVAGMVRALAVLIGPVVHYIFPSVPRRHPAMGAIIMTISANMMGLGNAVTPLGIKAMSELQKLNKDKESASPAMCTMLALCTTGFTLVPATIIAIRAAAGSVSPAEIVGPTMVVSFIATVFALVFDRVCQAVFSSRNRRL
ncbi:MAG: nucleoside recognition domain protein [Firmicutes bacterium]|nr:nucleoside recognition domain protein [Bacillota bacterium]